MPQLSRSMEATLINIVLLPMQRRVRLDDDGLARGVLEFFDQRRLARLQRFGDFRVDAQGQVLRVQVGGHFVRFGLDFVANRGDGLDHARAGAVGAGLAEHAFEGLLGAFARDGDQAKFVEAQDFRGRAIGAQGLIERDHDFFAVAALFHVDEVEDDDAAEIAQANLADDFLHRFEVGLDDGVLEARRAAANVLAGVDVDGHERFGVVDDDVAAGLEPDLGPQGFVELLLDAEFLEDRRVLV